MRSNGNSFTLRVWQVLVLAAVFVGWHVMTVPGIVPPFYFGDPNRAAFLFGEPLKVFGRIWQWFWGGDIYRHLWVTLVETLLAFAIGTILGIAIGIWLALAPTASAVRPMVPRLPGSRTASSPTHRASTATVAGSGRGFQTCSNTPSMVCGFSLATCRNDSIALSSCSFRRKLRPLK